MSQSKIKTLFKIFYIRSKFIFTIFFFLTGAVYHSEIFASDELRRALLSDEESPRGVDARHSLNSNPGEDDGVIEVVVRSPGSSAVSEPEWPADEGHLFAEIDTTLAESKMNEITDYLAFLKGGKKKNAVIRKYPHIDRLGLEDHLARNAWSAATEGPLSEFLGGLVDKIGELQDKCKEIASDKKTLLRSWATAVGASRATEASELKRQTEELKENARVAGTKNRCLKIALGSVMTVSLTGYAIMLLLWHPWR